MTHALSSVDRNNLYYASLQNPCSFASPQTGLQLPPMSDTSALQGRVTLPSLLRLPSIAYLRAASQLPPLNVPSLQGRTSLPPLAAPSYFTRGRGQTLTEIISMVVEGQSAPASTNASEAKMPIPSPVSSVSDQRQEHKLLARSRRAERSAAAHRLKHPRRFVVDTPESVRAKKGSKKQLTAAVLHINQKQFKEAVAAIHLVYGFLSGSREDFLTRLFFYLDGALDNSEDWVVSTAEKDMDVLILRGICCIKYANYHEARRVLEIVLAHKPNNAPNETLEGFLLRYACVSCGQTQENLSANPVPATDSQLTVDAVDLA